MLKSVALIVNYGHYTEGCGEYDLRCVCGQEILIGWKLQGLHTKPTLADLYSSAFASSTLTSRSNPRCLFMKTVTLGMYQWIHLSRHGLMILMNRALHLGMLQPQGNNRIWNYVIIELCKAKATNSYICTFLCVEEHYLRYHLPPTLTSDGNDPLATWRTSVLQLSREPTCMSMVFVLTRYHAY
jgi:hypothetical protein